MAKVKFGILATDVRKSIGGVTYSRNRFGAYVRARSAPVQPRSALQLGRRELLSMFSTLWRELTDPQREGWHALGQEIARTDSLGQTYNPTGLQMYVGTNLVRATFEEAAISVAPILDDPPVVGVIAANVTTAGVVEVEGPDLAPASDYMVYGAAPRSAGRTFVRGIGQQGLIRGGEWRLLFAGSPASGIPDNTFDVGTEYVDKFGPLTSAAGARVPLAVVPVTPNRFIFPPLRVDAIVS